MSIANDKLYINYAAVMSKSIHIEGDDDDEELNERVERISRSSRRRALMQKELTSSQSLDPATSINNDNNDSSTTSILQLLEEKEKDLELAAKIGHSLLEQNKELQERNDFLEESLNSSNETIRQLKYHLKQRSSLFHAFANYEDEENTENVSFGGTPNSPHSNAKKLEARLKVLEEENNFLKAETLKLEDLTAVIEQRETRRIKEFLDQLEKANFKIGRLQEQIFEKSKECELQAKDTEKLIKEIAQRKSREKILSKENDDLNDQLSEAISCHETLKVEIADLQERYIDVVGMLRETEDELRGYHQRVTSMQRTSSNDSLYDSLASELEASDSGCYNTPLFSARCESKQLAPNSLELLHPMSLRLENLKEQRNDLPILEDSASYLEQDEEKNENTPQIEDTKDVLLSEIMESLLKNETTSSIAQESYEVPSRALYNAVLLSTLSEESQASTSSAPTTSRSPRNNTNNNQFVQDMSKLEEAKEIENFEKPLTDGMSFSTISFQSNNSLKTIVPFHPEINILDKGGGGVGDKQKISPFDSNESLKSSSSSNNSQKSYQDASCSPIHFDYIENGEAKPTTSSFSSPKKIFEIPKTSLKQTASKLNNNIKKDEAKIEINYSPPKLGEPGRPGTRDLEFSIQRLNLRKEDIQIERDYERFRKQRGLPPSKFNFSDLTTPNNNSMKISKKDFFGPESPVGFNRILSNSINALPSNTNNLWRGYHKNWISGNLPPPTRVHQSSINNENGLPTLGIIQRNLCHTTVLDKSLLVKSESLTNMSRTLFALEPARPTTSIIEKDSPTKTSQLVASSEMLDFLNQYPNFSRTLSMRHGKFRSSRPHKNSEKLVSRGLSPIGTEDFVGLNAIDFSTGTTSGGIVQRYWPLKNK